MIPYRSVRSNSGLAPAELSLRIAAVTQRRHRWFRLPPADIKFVGLVDENRFRLVPVVRGQNTYAPLVLGEILPSERGSVVRVRMTLHPVAVAAVCALFSVVQYSATSDRGVLEWWPLVALGVFHVIMYHIGFLPEAQSVESALKALAG